MAASDQLRSRYERLKGHIFPVALYWIRICPPRFLAGVLLRLHSIDVENAIGARNAFEKVCQAPWTNS